MNMYSIMAVQQLFLHQNMKKSEYKRTCYDAFGTTQINSFGNVGVKSALIWTRLGVQRFHITQIFTPNVYVSFAIADIMF